MRRTPGRLSSAVTPPETAPEANIDECDFAVVDVETTGLSAAGGARVCEIGVVRVRGGAVMESFGTLVDPTVPVSAGAFAVNGISPAMLAGAPEFPAVAPRVESMLRGAVLVAYNAPFDVSFIGSEFRLAGLPPPDVPVVDALVLARQLFPGLPRHPQTEVARFLSIDGACHRALADAMVTARILIFMTAVLRAHGLNTLGDLSRRDLQSVMRNRKMEILRQAATSSRDVWIRYIGPGTGDITQRIVTPKAPRAETGDRTPSQITAWCHVVGANLHFRLDNILDLRPLGEAP